MVFECVMFELDFFCGFCYFLVGGNVFFWNGEDEIIDVFRYGNFFLCCG